MCGLFHSWSSWRKVTLRIKSWPPEYVYEAINAARELQPGFEHPMPTEPFEEVVEVLERNCATCGLVQRRSIEIE